MGRAGARHPLAFGRDRTLYYAMSGWDFQDGGPGGSVSVILSRSTDLGASWSSTVVRDARGKTGPQTENHSAVASLVVDTTSGAQDVVYVGWRASYPQAPPFPGGLRAHRPPLVAVSTDGGKTFGDPVDVSSFYKKTSKGLTGASCPSAWDSPRRRSPSTATAPPMSSTRPRRRPRSRPPSPRTSCQ